MPGTSLSEVKEVDREVKTRCLPSSPSQPQCALLEMEINMPANHISADGTSADKPVVK